MTIKHQPATPLPWNDPQRRSSAAGLHMVDGGERRGFIGCVTAGDAAYLVHASNAYPKLVKALREAMWAIRMLDGANESGEPDGEDLLRDLGEAP